MKKLILSFSFVVIMMFSTHLSYSQAGWEVGGRFGELISIDATIPLGISPRLHPSLYLDYFGFGTYFDWMFALNDGPAGLKFYPGVGPEFFFEHVFDFNIAGNFGVEYAFDFPLTVGFDWRPALNLTNDVDFRTGNWGFTARFRFGEGATFRRAD